MQLRAVSVLDGVDEKDNKCVWSSAYLGLFVGGGKASSDLDGDPIQDSVSIQR